MKFCEVPLRALVVRLRCPMRRHLNTAIQMWHFTAAAWRRQKIQNHVSDEATISLKWHLASGAIQPPPPTSLTGAEDSEECRYHQNFVTLNKTLNRRRGRASICCHVMPLFRSAAFENCIYRVYLSASRLTVVQFNKQSSNNFFQLDLSFISLTYCVILT